MLKKITIFFTLTALLLTFINAFAHEMSCEACLQCVGQSTVKGHDYSPLKSI